MLRTALVWLILAFTVRAAAAACNGEDLAPTMAPDDRAAIDAAISAVPYARGNAWLAQRGDARLFLVGTYHLGDPRHDAVLERIAHALDEATVVLVEAGPDEMEKLKSEMTRRPDLLFTTSGPTLPERLDETDWQMLVDAMRERGVPAVLASKMRPWYVSMMLGIPPCAMAEIGAGSSGLDARIIARAEARGIPLRALEPYDTIFGLFDAVPPEKQLDMIRATLAMSEQAEDYAATLTEAYFAEDVRLSWELGRLAAYDLPGMTRDEVDGDLVLMEESLVNRRNHAWLPVLEAAAEEGPAFAAFGAMHLSGEEGVLALLEREGFTIERQPF
ncbi:TraB/GumN family protein [Defluviimonas salinarum]|uniref:TraB/GumN family protein n=1 Tax=Defluviimonas salinarum TaxID=2992147 RepID=A0ABT3J4V9_9RHOB|nr:TraB/GumN family protein [Defluviimonas salinarum]MCW3782737.1 TraB/GumN family protein [Defluviimonas salinarum]